MEGLVFMVVSSGIGLMKSLPLLDRSSRGVLDLLTSTARFRTFDAISQFFQQATRQVPITLILDDLHWADTPSLLLLEFLSEEAQRSRLLLSLPTETATLRAGRPYLAGLPADVIMELAGELRPA